LGFLAAGYRTADQAREDLAAARRLTPGPLGINLFWIASPAAVDQAALTAFRDEIVGDARSVGVQPGEARWDDDDLMAKIAFLESDRPEVVSFTFGCPDGTTVGRLRSAGIAIWVTVTEVEE